uniref:Pancreatic trypsin inhibitor n=1 Tax=Rhipicephalus zambeziensis TaxID=60191 RepID=A0A224Y2G6_9ACAR
MRTSTFVAVLAIIFTMEMVFMTIQASYIESSIKRPAAYNFTIDCYRNETCRYPNVCWECPKPESGGYIRTYIFYFNVSTQSCETTVGSIDEERGTCNSFETETECEFYCGLNHEDDDSNESH